MIPGTDSLLSIHDFLSELFLIFKPVDPYKRLKWFGIDPLGESDVKKLDDMYGDVCKCEFKCEFKCTCCQFKCTCGWNENITLKEHQSFQDLRIVSKLGILGQPNLALLIVDKKVNVFKYPFLSKIRNTIQSKIQIGGTLD